MDKILLSHRNLAIAFLDASRLMLISSQFVALAGLHFSSVAVNNSHRGENYS